MHVRTAAPPPSSASGIVASARKAMAKFWWIRPSVSASVIGTGNCRAFADGVSSLRGLVIRNAHAAP